MESQGRLALECEMIDESRFDAEVLTHGVWMRNH
jgi:hypothetical protein